MSQIIKKVKIITELTEAQEYIDNIREPFLLRNYDIGPCVEKWTIEYLKEVVGSKEVKIHVSSVSDMNFIKKNFIYRSLPFNELIKRASNESNSEFFICEKERYYLRSLGSDERKDVSDIKKQFPQLSDDIRFPSLFEPEKFFSSVFRISSSNIRLWTHYDIMDNFLIQVTGVKKVLLYPPSDVDFMYMNGDKSEVIDVDNPDLNEFPLFANTTRYEADLFVGDVIFIPALWFHNVITQSFSIGVNVFWKHLNESLYEKNDIYGNKDLLPAAKSMDLTKRSVNEIKKLPPVYRDFYLRRMIQILKENI